MISNIQRPSPECAWAACGTPNSLYSIEQASARDSVGYFVIKMVLDKLSLNSNHVRMCKMCCINVAT